MHTTSVLCVNHNEYAPNHRRQSDIGFIQRTCINKDYIDAHNAVPVRNSNALHDMAVDFKAQVSGNRPLTIKSTKNNMNQVTAGVTVIHFFVWPCDLAHTVKQHLNEGMLRKGRAVPTLFIRTAPI